MIQRIQSVYLFLVIVLSVVFMTGTLMTYSNSRNQAVNVTFSKVSSQPGPADRESENKTLPITVLSIVIPLCVLITVFLYRKRKLQLKAAIITLCSEIILTGYIIFYFLQLKNSARDLVLGIRVVLPVIYIILTLLAIRGIRKDENLVKSYDRLR